LFGDGAAATLISAAGADSPARIGPFVFGTDGRGAKDLIVEAGGFRMPATPDLCIEEEDRHGNRRGKHNLYMNGANVMAFTLREVPRTFREVLERSGTSPEDYDYVVLHQANKFMLDALAKKLPVPAYKVPRMYEDIGNTVSSTIPFVLAGLQEEGRLRGGTRIMLIGFGVGLSWAGASVIL
jgi:3-oxoacyl-[acyl-carrier-protein] synthase-3